MFSKETLQEKRERFKQALFKLCNYFCNAALDKSNSEENTREAFKQWQRKQDLIIANGWMSEYLDFKKSLRSVA